MLNNFRMKITTVLFFCLLCSSLVTAQYEFTHTIDIPCTAVKSQDNTGTCWSFATASFIETELMRNGHSNLDLSEMFVVRNIYRDKAKNYVLRQGNANFSQGSLSHDLIRAISKHGIIPEKIYSGLYPEETSHNHSEMENALKGFLDGVMKSSRLSSKWPKAFDAILDVYIGAVPNEFNYGGKSYSPQLFAKHLGIDPNNYVSMTSFSHHDFYSSFILEIPDNYSNGSFYNLPINEMVSVIDQALTKGYSIAWDGDVSEKGFSASEGIAVLTADHKRKDLFSLPGEELKVTQELRQKHFESYSTTDDHLMHIIGKAKDQNGTEYYIVKNSWGKISPYEGFLYMSKAYVQMKTIAIMVNKNALSDQLKSLISE